MNDRTWLTLRRAVTLLLGAGGALMVGDYLYEGARRAEAEARLANVRAAWTVRGTPMFGCVARSATMERCYQHAQEVERRRAEAERAAFERRREEAEPKGETPPEIDSPTISPLDRLLEDSESAKHEAAHAVVAVRLGLPLESTDIIERHEAVGAAGNTIGVSQGFTTLREGSVRPWLKALPNEEARRNLEAFGAQGAAGIVAERHLGSADEHSAIQEDLTAVLIVASWLGLGEDTSDPPVRRFVAQATARAEEVLMQDGGAAWDSVTEALIEHRALSGDDVRNIVSEGGA